MKTRLVIPVLFAPVFFLSSCATYIYYSNDPVVYGNVKSKNDLNFSSGFNIGQYAGGVHLHGSYAVTDRIFASSSFSDYMASGTTTNGSSGVPPFHSVYKGYMLSGAGGYYKEIGKDAVFESSLGACYGTNFNHISTGDYNFYHWKIFIQPGIGYVKENIQVMLGIRCGLLYYLPHATGPSGTMPSMVGGSPYGIFEPGFSVSGGGKYLKIGLEISESISNLTNSDLLANYFVSGAVTDPLSFSLFLKFSLHKENQSSHTSGGSPDF